MKLIKLISSDKMLIGLVALIAVGMSFIYLGKGPETPAQSIQAKSVSTTALTTNTKIGAL